MNHGRNSHSFNKKTLLWEENVFGYVTNSNQVNLGKMQYETAKLQTAPAYSALG